MVSHYPGLVTVAKPQVVLAETKTCSSTYSEFETKDPIEMGRIGEKSMEEFHILNQGGF